MAWTLVLAATSMLAEVVAGWISNSLALLNGAALIAIAIYIFFEAYQRLLAPGP